MGQSTSSKACVHGAADYRVSCSLEACTMCSALHHPGQPLGAYPPARQSWMAAWMLGFWAWHRLAWRFGPIATAMAASKQPARAQSPRLAPAQSQSTRSSRTTRSAPEAPLLEFLVPRVPRSGPGADARLPCVLLRRCRSGHHGGHARSRSILFCCAGRLNSSNLPFSLCRL